MFMLINTCIRNTDSCVLPMHTHSSKMINIKLLSAHKKRIVFHNCLTELVELNCIFYFQVYTCQSVICTYYISKYDLHSLQSKFSSLDFSSFSILVVHNLARNLLHRAYSLCQYILLCLEIQLTKNLPEYLEGVDDELYGDRRV